MGQVRDHHGVPRRLQKASNTPVSREIEHVFHISDLGSVPVANVPVELSGLEI